MQLLLLRASLNPPQLDALHLLHLSLSFIRGGGGLAGLVLVATEIAAEMPTDDEWVGADDQMVQRREPLNGEDMAA